MNNDHPILLVDDDAAIREFVSMALADEGYTTVTAEDGAAALQLVQQLRPALILLDMRMPQMDGWAFARAYRQLPVSPVPIIVFSAAPNAGQWADEIGADGVLPKPFALDDLFTIIGTHLG